MKIRTDRPGGLDQVDLSPAVVSFLRDARCGLSLPFPGHGKTSERLGALRAQAATDTSVGRLLEAHSDAMAILFEAAVRPPPLAALAVWASGPTTSVCVEKKGADLVLNGKRSFCGGATIVDAAIVTADSPEGERLILVRLNQPGVSVDSGTWKVAAFRDAGIATVHFTDVRVETESFIGPPGWYGSRPGFWFGAVGVGAVWAGIADLLLSSLPGLRRHGDDLSRVATGSIEAAMWAATALLEQAASQIDAPSPSDPGTDPVQRAKSIALSCRHSVRSHLESAILAFDQEVGPAAVAFNADLARTRTELQMSLAQTHGARDLILLSPA